MRILRAALVGSLLCAAAAVFAVPMASAQKMTRFEVDFFDQRSSDPVNHATVWIAPRRVRIEQRSPGMKVGTAALIYRGDQDLFVSLDKSSRTYASIDRELVTSLGKQIRAARVEVTQQLQVLPHDQREAFERLLGVSASTPDMTRKPLMATAEGVVEEVGGFDCSRMKLERDGELVGRACVTPWKRVGMQRADMEVFRQLGNFQRELMGARGLTPMELVPNQPLDILVQFGGFPLYFERVAGGKTTSSIRVVEVVIMDDSSTLFDPPSDYQLREGFQNFASPLQGLMDSTPAASP